MENYNYLEKSNLSYEEASELLKQRLLAENPKRIIDSGYPELYNETSKIKIPNIFLQSKRCNIISARNCSKSFLSYMKIAEYPDSYYPDHIYEKSYEHFWCLQLLTSYTGEVFIDIASEQSPLSEIAMRLYGGKWFSQDIMYEEGIHDNRIGCNATTIPFDDDSVNGMCASCSIEHFEEDSDTLFLLEAERILKIGGKVVIAPLYIAPNPFTITDPIRSVDNVIFDKEGEIRLIHNWGNRHGRWYSPETLFKRLIIPTNNMKFTIVIIDDVKDIHKSIYCRFILIGEKQPLKKNIFQTSEEEKGKCNAKTCV